MSVKVEIVEKNVQELEIGVEAEKFSQAVNQAAKKISSQVNISGFRKGKAPRRVVEAHVGLAALYEEAIEIVLSPAYFEAINELKLRPVDRPEITIVQVEEGKEFIFKAKVITRPNAELGQYKGFNVEKTAAVVKEEDVEAELKNRQEQHARLITVEEGKVEKGNTANIDFEGFIDDVPFPGGKGEGYDLKIGSGQFIPGFEEQLIGAEIGQVVDVNVNFPNEYHSEDLSGKAALFKVKVNKIKKEEYAPLDDEFAKDVSPFDTLEELKADIRKKLLDMAESRTEAEFRNQLIGKAVENATVDIPEVMIEARTEAMLSDLYNNIQQEGLTKEAYFQYTNSNEEALRAHFRPQAVDSVKTELVLEAIIKAEGLEISEEAVNAELESLAGQYQQSAEFLRETLESRGEMDLFKQTMLTEKVVQRLIEGNA